MNSLDSDDAKTRFWHSLLPVFLGSILLVQAGSAYVYHFQLDQSVSPAEIPLGNSVTMIFHVYDTENGVGFSGAPVTISIYRTVPAGQVKIATTTTNASGWAVYTYTPEEAARFAFTSFSSANYSTLPGFPPVGMQSSSGDPPGLYFNVTSRSPLHVITNEPIGPIVFVTTTATVVHPVPSLVTLHLTPLTTQITPTVSVTTDSRSTQGTPALTVVPAVPAVQTDTTPPVTTFILAGIEDGSGGYSSDVICTLAAADNTGGSGVRVTEYSFDGTGWYTYSQPVSVVKAGTTTLYYRSTDNAGNTEIAKEKAIVISGPGVVPGGTIAAVPAGTISPLPLWPIALVILVLITAAGGALFLKSRQGRKEEKN